VYFSIRVGNGILQSAASGGRAWEEGGGTCELVVQGAAPLSPYETLHRFRSWQRSSFEHNDTNKMMVQRNVEWRAARARARALAEPLQSRCGACAHSLSSEGPSCSRRDEMIRVKDTHLPDSSMPHTSPAR